MYPFVVLLSVYVLGGFTLLPIVILALWIYAYLNSPAPVYLGHDRSKHWTTESAHDWPNALHIDDDQAKDDSLTAGQNADLVAGYFTIRRSFLPGDAEVKSDEKTSAASTSNLNGSSSVYQSVYNSVFDRKPRSFSEESKRSPSTTTIYRDVFFVVLRHNHLMLYVDSEQLELKHVIPLKPFEISIHNGDSVISEGDLWIKKNAIRLLRRVSTDVAISEPFFFFSDNCCRKEDFYFALLAHQRAEAGDDDTIPAPLKYDPQHLVDLVRRLHSSNEQLQTRWLNAFLGRMFLALYKTPEVENFVRAKLMKKIARVKKPAFLKSVILRKIDLGDEAPQVTNPRLKDFNVDGDCCIEADLKYTGRFRIEVAATARIDLGPRFKPREVDLMLAIVVKKLSGHVLLKIKPPPSNRLWVTFEAMPHIELAIEPIVSSLQITYGFILRTIEKRIREVIAETVVLPNWDDSPFFDTSKQKTRGGIWQPAVDVWPETLAESPEVSVEPLFYATNSISSAGTSTSRQSEADHDWTSDILIDTTGEHKVVQGTYEGSENTEQSSIKTKEDVNPATENPVDMHSSDVNGLKEKLVKSLSSDAKPGLEQYSPVQGAPGSSTFRVSDQEIVDSLDRKHMHSRKSMNATRSQKDPEYSPDTVQSNESLRRRRQVDISHKLSLDNSETVNTKNGSKSTPTKHDANMQGRKSMVNMKNASVAARNWGWGMVTGNMATAVPSRTARLATAPQRSKEQPMDILDKQDAVKSRMNTENTPPATTLFTPPRRKPLPDLNVTK